MKIAEMDKETVVECLGICVNDIDNHYQNFNFDIDTWREKIDQLIERLIEIEVEGDSTESY